MQFAKSLLALICCTHIASFAYMPRNRYDNVIADDVYFDSCCNPCSQWALGADFLYWKASTRGLPFAAEYNNLDPIFNFPTESELKAVEFNYKPGFRVWIGYDSTCDYGIFADWTHLYTYGHDRTDDATIINPIWFSVGAPVSFILAHQSINYDVVNIDFWKCFSVGNCFSFRPFFGVAGGRINQELKLENDAIFDDDVTGQENIKLENNFRGGGLRLGLETDYPLCGWFSLYGKGACSLLYGQFNLKKDDNIVVPELLDITLNLDDKERGVVAGFDIIAGLRSCWSLCGFTLTGHISYEFVLWPSQTRLYQIIPAGTFTALPLGEGDVSFQGLTLGLGVQF